MVGVRSGCLSGGRVGRRPLLAIGAGAVAVSAFGGAAGLATGADPYLRHLTDRLPLRSPVLGAAALSAVVGLPYTLLARDAWRSDERTGTVAVTAGALLVGWIGVEAAILRETSFLDPLYAAIGVLTIMASRRCGGPERTRRKEAPC